MTPEDEHKGEQMKEGVPEPGVLFICVHNAGRSQMAAGFLRSWGGDRVRVLSAGSEPGDRVNPLAVVAMAEKGIDIGDGPPQLLTNTMLEAVDFVVTMGCGDACPIVPGKRYFDWEVDDPSGMNLEGVRAVRDDLEQRVRALSGEIGLF